MSRFAPSKDFHALAQRDAKDARRELAERIVDRAGDLAPEHTGHYVDSLHVIQDGDRVVAATDDVAGHMVESGSVNNPAYSPLRRAASDVAARFDPS